MDITELETYGKRVNWKPIVTVSLFALLILVFVIILSITRSVILNTPKYSPITGFTGLDYSAEIVREVIPAQKNDTTLTSDSKKPSSLEASPSTDSFILSLSSSPLIIDLPREAVILLQVGFSFYAVTKSSIVHGKPLEPDISIGIPAKYARALSQDFCSTIIAANSNGDVSVSRHISQSALMWKYKSMFQYRNCLGM